MLGTKHLFVTVAALTGVAIAAYAEGQQSGPITEERLVEIVRMQEARIQELERRMVEQSRWLAQSVAGAELDRLRGGALPAAQLPRLAQLEEEELSPVILAQLAPAEERLRERREPVPPRPWPAVEPPPAPAAAPEEEPLEPAVAEIPDLPPEEIEPVAAEIPDDPLLLEAGAILLPQGTLQLEGSLDYTRFSGPRVAISGLTLFEAIVIGLIRVEELSRDIFTASATARYGITDRFQADVRVPYVYRHDSELRDIGTEEPSERRTSINNIGDVSARLSYQPIIGDGLIPDVILRAEAQFPTGKDPFGIPRVEVEEGVFRLAHPPTGSGFYEVGGGAMTAWRVDPVVFFAGATYTHRLARNFPDPFGRIEPGDSIQAFGGVNVRLTDRFGFNFAFVDQITFETKQNGEKRPGTRANDGRFLVGTSLALNPTTSLLASTGIGLTSDAPDFQFTMSLSHTLDLTQ